MKTMNLNCVSKCVVAVMAGALVFDSGVALAKKDSDSLNLLAKMEDLGDPEAYGAMGEATYYKKDVKSGVSEIFNAEVRVELPDNLLGVDENNADEAQVIVDLVQQPGETPYATCILDFTGLAADEDGAFRAHYSVKLRRSGEQVMPDTGICVADADQSAGDVPEDDNPGKDDNDGIRPVMPETQEGDLAIGEINDVTAMEGVFEKTQH